MARERHKKVSAKFKYLQKESNSSAMCNQCVCLPIAEELLSLFCVTVIAINIIMCYNIYIIYAVMVGLVCIYNPNLNLGEVL